MTEETREPTAFERGEVGKATRFQPGHAPLGAAAGKYPEEVRALAVATAEAIAPPGREPSGTYAARLLGLNERTVRHWVAGDTGAPSVTAVELAKDELAGACDRVAAKIAAKIEANVDIKPRGWDDIRNMAVVQGIMVDKAAKLRGEDNNSTVDHRITLAGYVSGRLTPKAS